VGSPPEDAAEAVGDRDFVFDLDVRSALLVAAVGAFSVTLFAIARSSSGNITRVSIGVLLAVALNPVVVRLQRRGLRRGLAVAVVASGLVAVFAVVLTLLAPQAISQARDFSDELPATVEELYSWPIVGERLERADAATRVEEWVDSLPAQVDDETLTSVAEAVLGGALATVIVVVTALAVLLDADHLVRRASGVADPAHRERASRIGHILYRTFGSYFAGSLFVAVLNGLVILTAGLILGVPLAPLAGIWAALTNLIPQVGGFLGGSFFVLLALTKSPLTALIAAAIFLGYQQLENNVIQPAVVGQAVNLTPPTTMLAALVGGAAAGVPGALVATPLVGAMKALYFEQRGVALPDRSPPVLQRLRGLRQRHQDPDG
jgi:predicted PurR-regulated permease PerM